LNEEVRIFDFDRILGPKVSQEESYNRIGNKIVSDVMSGYNGTIMAYGQTGSGKTFTIFGKKTSMDYQEEITPEMGIIPRSIKQIFSTIKENSSKIQYQIRVSFMQVYMEQITDLIQEEGDENNILSPSSPNPNPMVFTSSNKKVGYNIKDGLQIREDPKSGIFVKGLKQVVRKIKFYNISYKVFKFIFAGIISFILFMYFDSTDIYIYIHLKYIFFEKI